MNLTFHYFTPPASPIYIPPNNSKVNSSNSTLTLHIHYVEKDYWIQIDLNPLLTTSQACEECLGKAMVPLQNTIPSYNKSIPTLKSRNSIYFKDKKRSSLSSMPSIASFHEVTNNKVYDSTSSQDDLLQRLSDNKWGLFHLAKGHWLHDSNTLENQNIKSGELLQLQRRSNYIHIPLNHLHLHYAQGYLEKLTFNKSESKWKSRWCILRDTQLEYFKSPYDKQPLGIIDLNHSFFSFLDLKELPETLINFTNTENHHWLAPMIIKILKKTFVFRVLNLQDNFHWTSIFRSIYQENQKLISLQSEFKQMIISQAFLISMSIHQQNDFLLQTDEIIEPEDTFDSLLSALALTPTEILESKNEYSLSIENSDDDDDDISQSISSSFSQSIKNLSKKSRDKGVNKGGRLNEHHQHEFEQNDLTNLNSGQIKYQKLFERRGKSPLEIKKLENSSYQNFPSTPASPITPTISSSSITEGSNKFSKINRFSPSIFITNY